ncbi:hypothetical protein [Metaplanococcus flavidus]|uniref:Uncharacterized protein n=1 Tax=Metaplanococcus flavidus TaxID=569883 RepID=A0ABW3L6T0_9BACL
MALFILNVGLGLGTFQWPVTIALFVAPVLLIIGIVWLTLIMKKREIK